MSFIALAGAIGTGATAALGATLGAGGMGLMSAGTAAAIGSGLGAVGAGALGGAGLGALSSAVTGGDVGKGALFGALGGGVSGGLSSAIGSLGSTAATAGSTTGTAAGSAAAPTTVAPSAFSNLGGSQAIQQSVSQAAPNILSNPAANAVGTFPTSQMAGNASQLGQVLGSTPAATGSTMAAQASPYAGTLFGEYATPIIGVGSMAGNYMASDSGPTQATPPMPYGGDGGMLSYYKFNPKKYKPQAPGYTGYLYANPTATPAFRPAYYAEGGIASLNPNPNMMSSGPAQVDFMGQDAYPTSQQKMNFYSTPSQMPTSAQQAAASYEPATNPLTGSPMANFASGGISDLGGYSDGGRMTEGPGDGMSDSIPASIAGKRPARLAQGEFVVPADVVSHLGNGSTDAGAKQLYSMMDRVRKARTGRKAQGKQIKPAKMMPA